MKICEFSLNILLRCLTNYSDFKSLILSSGYQAFRRLIFCDRMLKHMKLGEKMLSETAKQFQEIILKKGLKLKVIEFPSSTKTVMDAANTIGCKAAQIVKSLIFRTKETKRPILVLASGSNRVNEKKIAQYIKEDIEKADADFTRKVTGFAIGGIPPFGHKEKIETYIDEDLLKYKEVWAAAGTPFEAFCLEGVALEKITDGNVISIK